jgi:hypothetical protein
MHHPVSLSLWCAAIPATVVAAASFDDMIAITGYTIFISVAVSSGGNRTWKALHGPLSVIFGILLGVVAAVICSFTKLWDNYYKRTAVVLFTGGCRHNALTSHLGGCAHKPLIGRHVQDYSLALLVCYKTYCSRPVWLGGLDASRHASLYDHMHRQKRTHTHDMCALPVNPACLSLPTVLSQRLLLSLKIRSITTLYLFNTLCTMH